MGGVRASAPHCYSDVPFPRMNLSPTRALSRAAPGPVRETRFITAYKGGSRNITPPFSPTLAASTMPRCPRPSSATRRAATAVPILAAVRHRGEPRTRFASTCGTRRCPQLIPSLPLCNPPCRRRATTAVLPWPPAVTAETRPSLAVACATPCCPPLAPPSPAAPLP